MHMHALTLMRSTSRVDVLATATLVRRQGPARCTRDAIPQVAHRVLHAQNTSVAWTT